MKKRTIPFVPKEERAKLNEGDDSSKNENVNYFWTPPLSGDTPNYNIVGDNRIRKVFKIEIPDNLSICTKDFEDYIYKVAEKFKRVNLPQPDLDCGIYKDEEYFLPTNSNNMHATYMQVIPNSHFWTDLKQITYSIGLELQRQKREADEKYATHSIYVGEPLTRDYILIGLGNSLMRGYNLKRDKSAVFDTKNFIIFDSIEDMIDFVQNKKFTLEGLSILISNTIKVGINLTNGKKMEREHVYKRIDAERKYQDLRWNSGQRAGDTPDEEKPVAEWLNYIEYHLSKAKDCNYHLNKEDALEELRKVAALAVRAMEIHGCPERIMPTRIGNKIINFDSTITYHTDNCDAKPL
jgi:hypothetical protein